MMKIMRGEEIQLDEASFDADESYRLAPRTVTITGPGGTFEIPEPVREEFERGAQYWIVDITLNNPIALLAWNGSKFDERALSRGLCHATRENAQAHADALAKLMQKEAKP